MFPVNFAYIFPIGLFRQNNLFKPLQGLRLLLRFMALGIYECQDHHLPKSTKHNQKFSFALTAVLFTDISKEQVSLVIGLESWC